VTERGGLRGSAPGQVPHPAPPRTRRPVRIALLVLGLLVVTCAATVTAGAPARAASIAPHVYSGGGVIGFGDAQAINPPSSTPLSSVVVTMAVDPASTPSQQGYWLAAADGGVFARGSAGFYGSLGSLDLTGPIVAMAGTADGRGYWLAALDGGVFAFGDAAFYGSMGGIALNQPVVGMAPTPDGKGYWLVASDGGIFAFGDAAFYGSMGGVPLNAPVAAMASTGDGRGYWMVASDGGIFALGDAGFYGSLGGQSINDPVVAMTAAPGGTGYLMVGTDGSVYRFGTAPSFGSLGGGYLGNPFDVPPIAGIALTPDARGYWLLEPDGWSYTFTAPGRPPPPSDAAIVSIADGQVASDPPPGNFCNPYGPCEEWCSLFATWVWEQAGVPIPSYPFTGNIYDWAAANTAVLPPDATPAPGDAVLYGTGPWSTATSLHVGIVAEVWPDGAIVTIEGDAGPAPNGSLAVVINGPYLPSQSPIYNGMPIYAYAVP
jgi:CHAP domain